METGSEDGRATVRIRDDGCGVSPEHLPRLFELGFTTKTPSVGRGVGLAVARHVVEPHGGTIELTSTEGATVIIRLPIQNVGMSLALSSGMNEDILDQDPGLSRYSFWMGLLLAVGIFLTIDDPFSDPFHIDGSILWSYAVVPPLAGFLLFLERKLAFAAWLVESTNLALAKFGVTLGIALVLWIAAGSPDVRPKVPVSFAAPAEATPRVSFEPGAAERRAPSSTSTSRSARSICAAPCTPARRCRCFKRADG